MGDGSPKCRIMKTSANVQMANTKEDKAGQDGYPKCRLMKTLANVRISNTKEDKAKVDKYIFRDLGFRPGTDGTHLKNAASGKCRQMSGSQIPKRIRRKGISTFSGTWALGQGRTGRISQMPPQENDRGSQANVRISNTKEDKAKVDKHIFRDLGFGARDGRDASPKCGLRKTTADLRQMSGSQIPKRIRGDKYIVSPKCQRKMSKIFQ